MSGYHVVYKHFHVISGVERVFYVGMGNEKRPKELGMTRSPQWLACVKRYGKPRVQVLHWNLTYEHACAIETAYICRYGRLGRDPGGTLVNILRGVNGHLKAVFKDKAA